MADEQSFVRQFMEDPKDDGSRFAYAEWLRRGRPNDAAPTVDDPAPLNADADRAEFICSQCMLASGKDVCGRSLGVEELQALRRREEELFKKHRNEWERPLRELGVQNVVFGRGFPDHVVMDAPAFLEQAAELFALAPVRSLSISMSLRTVAHAAERLTMMQRLAQVSYLQRLSQLSLSYNSVSDAEIRLLANSPYISNLTHLNLSGGDIGNAGAAALAKSPYLYRLSNLNLRENSIGDQGAQALADSPYLQNVTSLDLGSNKIGDEGALALLQSRNFQHLRELKLDNKNLGSAVQREIERVLTSRRMSHSR